MAKQTKTFRAVRVSAAPGHTILKLTAPWRHDAGTLPAGSEVTPFSAGYDNVLCREYRTVVFRGQRLTGAA